MQKRKDCNIWRSKASMLSLMIEDIDFEKRIVKAYNCAFDNVDSDRDVLLKGCTMKSIKDRGPASNANAKIQHVFFHDLSRIIGKPLEMYEDAKGSVFISKIIQTQEGIDRLIEYQEGVLNNHSVGFKYVPDKMEYDEKDDIWYIKEINLFEFSAVPFGANESTPVLEITKGLSKAEKLEKLNEQFYANLRVSKSKASDEACKAAEYRLKMIHSQIIELLTTPNAKEAVKNDTLKAEEPVDTPKAGFFHHLIEGEARKKDNFFNHLTDVSNVKTKFRGFPPKEGD